MVKRTSFNISEENDAYLSTVAGSNKTDFLNEMLTQLRAGQVAPIAKKEGGADMNCIYNMPALSNAALDFSCPPKTHYADLAKPDKKAELLKFCGKCPRHAEHMANVKLKLKYPKAFERLPDIEQEPEPKPAPVAAAPTVSKATIEELPAGLALVGCDSCNEKFVFDHLDRGLDDLTAHLKDKHSGRVISTNEANQFRHARARLERAAAQ